MQLPTEVRVKFCRKIRVFVEQSLFKDTEPRFDVKLKILNVHLFFLPPRHFLCLA